MRRTHRNTTLGAAMAIASLASFTLTPTMASAQSSTAASAIPAFTPEYGSQPDFACKDDSYAKARDKGFTLGIVDVAPYTIIKDKIADYSGIDWDIWQEILKFTGITKVKYSVQSWGTMVPALTSGRIDAIGGNFHATTERVKKINFTSPAWWYGPAIVVRANGPAKITSFSQLADKNIKVGVLAGSNQFLYLNDIHANVTPYQTPDQELASLANGHDDAVVEDAPVIAEFLQKRPDAKLKMLDATLDKADIYKYGFGYARYGVRKADCTLNFAVSRALSELRAQGVIQQILAKYGLNHNTTLPYVK